MDPFQTLGIEPAFELDSKDLEQRHRELSRALHPDRHVGKTPGERRHALGRAIEVNDAYRIVKDPVRRAEALLARLGLSVEEGAEPKAAPDFLMEVMEQRELLSEARTKRDRAGLERLRATIEAQQADALGRLARAFAAATPDSAALLGALGELRYFARFLEEAGAIEDELL